MTDNLPVTANDIIKGITQTKEALKRGGQAAILKMNKGGYFVYGEDELEVEDGSQWAVNPASLSVGYVAWKDGVLGAPQGEKMRSIYTDPVVEADLPNLPGCNWVQQVGMQLMCVSGEDTGVQVVYKSSSKSGRGGFRDFLDQVMINIEANPSSDKVVPVVCLEKDHYEHKEWGRIHLPVFKIKSWTTMNDIPQVEAEDSGDATGDEPADEPEVVEDAPTKKRVRRRRGKAA